MYDIFIKSFNVISYIKYFYIFSIKFTLLKGFCIYFLTFLLNFIHDLNFFLNYVGILTQKKNVPKKTINNLIVYNFVN